MTFRLGLAALAAVWSCGENSNQEAPIPSIDGGPTSPMHDASSGGASPDGEADDRGGAGGSSGGADGAAMGEEAGGIDGAAGRDGGEADRFAEASTEGSSDATLDRTGGDAPATDADGSLEDPWLRTSTNHIYRGAKVFHGRGANFFDTRSCNACAYDAPNVDEIKRRANELIDNWKANFIRLNLESYDAADDREHWRGVLDDAAYRADLQNIVAHISGKGAYVLLSLWVEPTATENELPTARTNEVWKRLADMFKNEPRVLYGITNEPHGDTDQAVWDAMNSAVAAIREVETLAGTPKHIIAVQGTQEWARILDYYVTHPITAGGGQNIVYETHVYNPASDFHSLFEVPGLTIPVIIGEFGDEDADILMQRAEAAEIPYLAWAFHMRCPPNLLVDDSDDGCGVGMSLTPTAFGQKLKNRLAIPW